MPSMLLGSSLARLLAGSGLLAGSPPLPATSPEPRVEARAATDWAEPPAEAETVEPESSEPAEAEPTADTPHAASPELDVLPLGPPPVPDSAPVEPKTEEPVWITVSPPRWRGTGMFIAAGGVMFGTLTFQILDALACGNCTFGPIERLMLITTMGMAAGGGVTRAHADAFDDTALRRERPDTQRALVAGATLIGIGAVVGLVNEGMWWRCVLDRSGPYRLDQEDVDILMATPCRYHLSRGLIDLASVTTATGLGLLSWSLTYRRDARAYARARVIGLRPTLGRERWGLSLGGRF
jgi:hypothetical protein